MPNQLQLVIEGLVVPQRSNDARAAVERFPRPEMYTALAHVAGDTHQDDTTRIAALRAIAGQVPVNSLPSAYLPIREVASLLDELGRDPSEEVRAAAAKVLVPLLARG